MHWLDQIVDDVIARHPEGEILIESGGSPSGTYHLGHMRELVTCDAILLALRRRGRQARHIYFVDDLDVFRKVPANVPAEWEQYLGMPLCDVPSPDGIAASYADYFLQGLVDSCEALHVEVEFVRSHPKYRSGWFVPAIELCLEHIPDIRTTLERISNRKLDDSWTPVQIMEKGRLKNRRFISIDKTAKTVTYEGSDGQPGVAHYDKGEVKLDWRLDWPARWWMLKVQVEPFGREHASAGGSFDTGLQLMHDIYHAEAPIPVPYDSIHMVGDTKKMSASKGTAISAMEGVQIMPAEVIRYFILRAPLNRPLQFDPVEGVVKLIDEFAELTAKPRPNDAETELLYVATRGEKPVVSRVPFSHLVASYQASLKNADETLEVIKRTEYKQIAQEDADVIRAELKFIDAWLEKRAPEDIKFSLLDAVNVADFNEQEQHFLRTLGQKVAQAPADADGAWFHDAIYGFKDETGMAPKELFSTLYRALIGKQSGPRAGWFLSMLPRDWLVARLSFQDAISKDDSVRPEVEPIAAAAQLTDGTRLVLDEQVRAAFPNAAIGYIVATLPASETPLPSDPLASAMQALADAGITAENLTSQPQIAAWRAAFQTFGVKPSKYLCSAEALAKRALKGNPAHVSPVVDAYNSISIKHLLPMGALDLDKLDGDLTIRYGHDGETASLLGIEGPVSVSAQQVVYADQSQIVTWLWNHRDAAATAVTHDTKHAVFLADSLDGAAPARAAIAELSELLEQIGAQVVVSGTIGASA